MYYVYKLICENGIYVGFTKNLEDRLYRHMHHKGSQNHPYLSYEIMVMCKTEELARYFEDIAIQKYGTLNKYRSGNISSDAEYDRDERHSYYLANKEHENFRNKLYWERNKERLGEYSRNRARSIREGERMMFPNTRDPYGFGLCYRRMFKV